MPDETLRWTDIEDIGILLSEAHPDLDPLTVRFTELLRLICALPQFDDDPKASNEKRLEAVQAVWFQEYQDTQ